MKSERPDEQETTTTAKVMAMPNVGRIWAGRAAMALSVIAVIAAFVFSRVQRTRQQAADARELLASAMQAVTAMDGVGRATSMNPEPLDSRFVEAMQRSYEDAKLKLDTFGDRSTDKNLNGQAALLRGDMNLAIASAPAIPGAATQPAKLTLHPSRDEAHQLATDAYKDVLNKYVDQPNNAAAARMGLATIAMDHRDLKTAGDYLQAVVADDKAADLYRQSAKRKLADLKGLEATPLIETQIVLALPSAPTSAPAVAPTGAPTSAPTTKTTAPSTSSPAK